MRAMGLGVLGVSWALALGVLLPAAASAAPTAFGDDDLSVEWVTVPTSVVVGTPATFTARVRQIGAANANVVFNVTLPSTFGFTAITTNPGGGFATCNAPSVGNTGHISCTAANFATGSQDLVFQATAVSVGPGGSAEFRAAAGGGGADDNDQNNITTRSVAVTNPPLPEPDDNLDPGYPPGWGYGGLGGGYGYDDYCDYDCY